MISYEEIRQLAQENYDWAVETRRAFHRIPEPGFAEEKTKALIVEKLKEIGVEYEVSPQGWISAYIPGSREGKITALRADFDALPVDEPVGCPFRSENPGYMHACGHDMHTSIMLATARLLKSLPEGFEGGCLLLFEPAEETDGGAKIMAESGIMERLHVDRVYGLHVMPRILTGQIESRPGTLNASTDSVVIKVNGTASHGAYPENGCDAIVCAGQMVSALQTIVARNVAPLENAVLSIGTINGGKANNIICDKVVMQGTLRCANRELRAKLVKRINEVCEYTARALGCTAEVEINEGYAALVNDSEHAARVLLIASEMYGNDKALVKDAPSMGAEDFSYFLDHAPGAFFHVGCSPDEDHICAPLHSEKFNPDERAMRYGIEMEAALVLCD